MSNPTFTEGSTNSPLGEYTEKNPMFANVLLIQDFDPINRANHRILEQALKGSNLNLCVVSYDDWEEDANQPETRDELLSNGNIVMLDTSDEDKLKRVQQTVRASQHALPIVLMLTDRLLGGFELCELSEAAGRLRIHMVDVLDMLEDPSNPVKLFEEINRLTQNIGIKTLGDFRFDKQSERVQIRGEAIHLTPIEYQLLFYLAHNLGKPVSKEELFMGVWGYQLIGDTNLVEVAIRRLREKIEEIPSSPLYIKTLRGLGYRFNPSSEQKL